MFCRIMDDVASLAQGFEVAQCAVAWIMVEVRTGQHRLGGSNGCESDATVDRHPPAAIGSPAKVPGIPPASVAEMSDPTKMRPTAMLTSGAGAPEPHVGRELFPVDGIEPAVLGTDRHSDSMSQVALEQKGKVQLSLAQMRFRLFILDKAATGRG